MSSWRPTRLDVLLSLAVAAAGLVESFGRPGQIEDPVPLAAGALAAGTLLLFRRRFPLTMLLALTAVGTAVRAGMDGAFYFAAWQFYSTLILVHTVGGAAGPRGRRGLAGLAGVLLAYAWIQTLPGNDVAEVMISAVFVGVAYGSGLLLRRQTDETTRLARHAARLEVEREERDRRAVAAERARLARELHDVVSHNVSLMTLQTGGVRMLLGDDRERERDLLRGVERAGREAIAELRLMLGVLREDTGPDAPRPGLDRLDELVERVRAAGPDVRLRITGEPRRLPPGLDLAAYRVVQEALTNVLKHARAARADVVVAYGADDLRLEIADDGTGTGGAPGAGHGLIGMRERTAVYGGELSAGPRPGGGHRVCARFPLAAD